MANIINKLIALPFRYKPWRPEHISIVFDDIKGLSRQPAADDETHLKAAIEWLCRAQDQRRNQNDHGGVSAGWSFEDGWLPSYPETSGYIVETFLAAEKTLNNPDLKKRASQIIEWELSIQNADGSFPGHFGEHGSKPVIFNTGQIMHGMLAGYIGCDRDDCLEAAVKAGYWMLSKQDDDGCWRSSVHNDTAHTYNTRAAWALMKTGMLANKKELVDGASKNIKWALTQQCESGWFKTNAFTSDGLPFTHNIAYAIRGILECGILMENQTMIDAAVKASRAQAAQQRQDGWLAGRYDDKWHPQAKYCCLTGLAQMSIIWLRLAQTFGIKEFEQNAESGICFVKSNQRITGKKDHKDGAIAGSAPIWGRYSMFEYPNWAAKFFADALMIRMTSKPIPETDRS
ncbi:MAG: prenyltransferase/squalene oxidase repeat-containing protein [Gammaproteobacteria bacterium]